MTDTPLDPRFAKVPCLFFVIGAQKSGTTWLHRYFAQHPEVSVPVHKETNYWRAVDVGKNYDALAFLNRYRRIVEPTLRARFRRLVRRATRPKPELVKGLKLVKDALARAGHPHRGYADLIFQRKTPRTRAAGEICPQYALLSDHTYREMAGLGDRTVFVFVMRDPVARAISAIKHGLRSKYGRKVKVDAAMLDSAITAALQRKKGWGFDKSYYHKTLATLESAVPHDRIHLMFYETMFEDREIARLNGFLGIGPHQADFGFRANADTQLGVPVDPASERALAVAFADVYDAMATRFGDALPDAWRASMALAAKEEVADV